MQGTENKEKNLSYCEGLVRAHDRDLYILALSSPPESRDNLYVLYALATELSHLRHMVSEEMIGHIRYAWWREALEKIYSGTTIPGHPVLEALLLLTPLLPQSGIMALLNAYADSYPAPPQGEWQALESLSLPLLSPQARTAWQKTFAIITTHHTRYGTQRRNWLIIKLLWAGCKK